MLQGHGAVVLSGSDIDFDYTIFAEHTEGSVIPPGYPVTLHVQPGGTADLSLIGVFSGNVHNTNAGGYGGAVGTIIGEGGMLTPTSVDFVSPGGPNFDYHLQSTSPAVDAATGSTTTDDVDKEVRWGKRDIGADEYDALLFGDDFESGNTAAWSSSS
jgi:hypothetical protein